MSIPREDIAQRVNFVLQNTPFEKLTPELWSRIQGATVKVGDYHDENTLMKVGETIRLTPLRGGAGPYLTHQEVLDIISALQNAGILFREIEKEPT